MMWHAMLCLSLGSLCVVAAEEAAARVTSTGGAPGTAAHAYLSEERSSRLRIKELQRMIRLVDALGGTPEHARILLFAGKEFRIDPVLLASLTYVESSFRQRVSSRCGARGLMQVRPLVLKVLGVTDPWDPYQNIMAGTAYLLHCFERYERHPHSTYLALAAYNIGPGPTRKLMRSDAARRFVKKVLRVYNRLTDDPIPIGVGTRNVGAQRRYSRRSMHSRH